MRFLDTEDYLDTLAIEGRVLRNLEKLLETIALLTCNRAFTVPCRAYWDNISKKWMHEYPSWFDPFQFNSLADWAWACLEREIWAKFWQMNHLDPRYSDESIPYSLEYKILHSIDTVLVLPGFLRELNKNSKEDLVGDNGTLSKLFQEVKEKLKNCRFSHDEKGSFQTSYYGAIIDNSKDYQNSKSVNLILNVLSSNSEEVFIEFLLCSPLDRAATILDLTARIVAFKIKEVHTSKMAEELLKASNPPSCQLKKLKKRKKKQSKSKAKAKDLQVKEETKEVTDSLMKKMMRNPDQAFPERKPHRNFCCG